MSELLQAQRAFAESLRAPAQSRPLAAQRWLVGDAAHVERRLAIYRANVAEAAHRSLAGAYPVVQQLVGEEFFAGLARAYLRAYPSRSGDLTAFGADYAGFIAGFPHTQSLPYLPDLARLEWRVHLAYGAQDADAFDVAAFAQVAPERQADICLAWAPGTALVASPHPIARLWQIHQADFVGNFTVEGSTAECALVARAGFAVVVSAPSAAEAAFIVASLAGAPLGTACGEALAADPGFDPGALLTQAVAAHLITGFNLPPTEATS